jgi:hypothetical protein
MWRAAAGIAHARSGDAAEEDDEDDEGSVVGSASYADIPGSLHWDPLQHLADALRHGRVVR